MRRAVVQWVMVGFVLGGSVAAVPAAPAGAGLSCDTTAGVPYRDDRLVVGDSAVSCAGSAVVLTSVTKLYVEGAFSSDGSERCFDMSSCASSTLSYCASGNLDWETGGGGYYYLGGTDAGELPTALSGKVDISCPVPGPDLDDLPDIDTACLPNCPTPKEGN